MRSGWVFNIQKYSVQDGPGIRTTVFLKGCPLCCSWCHNPEGISSKREVIVVETRCLACGECLQACPFSEAESVGSLETDRADCTLCEACVQACPTGARQVVGRSMTVAKVMVEILKDRIFHEESGGGVTFSGGEPLAQPEFVKDLLVTCRSRGIHTVVDTCGFSRKASLREVAELADLLLHDLKLMDDRRLGQVYSHATLAAPTPERMEEIANFPQTRGLRAKIGGG